MFKKIACCRICKNTNLVTILNLGNQMLTGVFPKQIDHTITNGPLTLVKCDESVDDACGLVQLGHSYDVSDLYGLNYGYRSGLNISMVNHLHSKINHLKKFVKLKSNDIVIDIGSNDCTTLKAYPDIGLTLIGIDPTGSKFLNFYPKNIELISDYFSSQVFKKNYPKRKAKVITSFSMFYDLEDPVAFMREVFDILSEDGIWIFEQSYMPSMIETNSFDTVCHEHLEFYRLKQIYYMTEKVGFHIIDVEFNDINGGSISVIVRKKTKYDVLLKEVFDILKNEKDKGFSNLGIYREFSRKVECARDELRNFIDKAKLEGKKIAALGASTKGNVILQFCNITPKDVEFIGEVNSEKFGCFTPNTWIPIISEEALLKMNYDYLIVLPWHFKNFFENNLKFRGNNLVYPLPSLSI